MNGLARVELAWRVRLNVDASGRWGGGPFNDGEHVSQALGDYEIIRWFDLADYDGDGLLDLLTFTVGTGRVLLPKGARRAP